MLKSAKLIISMTICLYFFLPFNANAEFYNYTDDNGITHFTDDYSTVPDKFKKQIKINEEIESDDDSVVENSDSQESQELIDAEENSSASELKREDLEKKKAELDSRYLEIQKKQVELNDEKKKVKTKKQADEYNKKINELNKIIEAYEKDKEQFNEDVHKFNKQIAQEALKKAQESEKRQKKQKEAKK